MQGPQREAVPLHQRGDHRRGLGAFQQRGEPSERHGGVGGRAPEEPAGVGREVAFGELAEHGLEHRARASPTEHERCALGLRVGGITGDGAQLRHPRGRQRGGGISLVPKPGSPRRCTCNVRRGAVGGDHPGHIRHPGDVGDGGVGGRWEWGRGRGCGAPGEQGAEQRGALHVQPTEREAGSVRRPAHGAHPGWRSSEGAMFAEARRGYEFRVERSRLTSRAAMSGQRALGTRSPGRTPRRARTRSGRWCMGSARFSARTMISWWVAPSA
jgi:hypothetical protein